MKQVIIFILVLLSSGCATIYRVDVDSIANTTVKASSTYYLEPLNAKVSVNSLQFQEYSLYAEQALGSRGYLRVDEVSDAELAIYLDYGIGDPQTDRYTHTTPVEDPNLAWQLPKKTVIKATTTYLRYIVLEAIDFTDYRQKLQSGIENPPIKEIWRLAVTSRGEADDLRLVFPVLIKAGTPYIGTNTGRIIRVDMYE